MNNGADLAIINNDGLSVCDFEDMPEEIKSLLV